jgi:hypothetical protein
MWLWLQSLPEWEEILLIIALLAVGAGLVVALIVLLLRGRGVSIGKEGVEIDAATGQAIAPRRRRSPHEGCRHVGEIVLAINKIMEVQFKVFRLKYVEMLQEQVSYGTVRSVVMRGMLEQTFLDALSTLLKKSGDARDLLTHRDYRMYSLCLDKIMVQNSVLVETAFRENHYIELDEVAFDHYASGKIDTIIQMTTNLLNSAYYGEVLTRAELYKLNVERVTREIKDLMYEVFLNARSIAKAKQAEIERLQREGNAYVLAVLGDVGIQLEDLT